MKLVKLPNGLTVQVLYLHGRLSLEITKSTFGKELFTLVCACLGVNEYWYFGLQYERKEGATSWLRPGKRVLEAVGPSGAVPLHFLVKYYPEDVGKVQDEGALALIYHQCRKEIVSGSLFCPAETSVLLASYCLQSELGDWAHVDHSLLDPGQLIPSRVLRGYPGVSPRGWWLSLLDWHRDHEGLTPAEARREYLRVAQYLGTYGVSFFKAKTSGREIWVGVQPKGLNLYEGPTLLVPQVTLRWSGIRLLSHAGCRRLLVRQLPETRPAYLLQAGSKRSAEQLFELAVGYHHLHVRTRLLSVISVKNREDSEAEKYKETTEELHGNQVKKTPPGTQRNLKKSQSIPRISLKVGRPLVKKHSCVTRQLATLKEE